MEDVQTALNEEVLVKPYVALVDGSLDYNTVEPASASYIGEWSVDVNTYTFQIIDDDPSYWEDDIQIATTSLYWDGSLTEMDVTLHRGEGYWGMKFKPQGEEEASEFPEYNFYGADAWAADLQPEEESSDNVTIEFDGTDTFTFNSASANFSMTTINPTSE